MNEKFEQARQMMRDAVAEEFCQLTSQGHRPLGVQLTKLTSTDIRTASSENRSLFYALQQLTRMSAVLRQMDNCDPNCRRIY